MNQIHNHDAASPTEDLLGFRHEIDAIDNELVALLEKRFAITKHVGATKARDGTISSPFRPAREAEILRRLSAHSAGKLDARLLVRLWRAIFMASSLAQGAVTLHLTRKLAGSAQVQMMVRDHFGALPVEEYRDEAQLLLQVEGDPHAVAVVDTECAWIAPFLEGRSGSARVFAGLPIMQEDEAAMPRLLLIGAVRREMSGNDHTLVITNGRLPRDFAPRLLWDIKQGSQRLSCLQGFYTEHEGPLLSLIRLNPTLNLKIAGQYPAPLVPTALSEQPHD